MELPVHRGGGGRAQTLGPQCDRGVMVAGEKCPGPRHPEEGFMEEVTLEALYDE